MSKHRLLKKELLFRALDANINRLRESLRVLEDFVRFQTKNKKLILKIKLLRHDFKKTISSLPYSKLIISRDIKKDEGKKFYPASEASRPNILTVLQANIKRTQESLRVLEENAKLVAADLGKKFKILRFKFYDLEKEIFYTFFAKKEIPKGLYVITSDEINLSILLKKIKEAIAGGVKIIQLRNKKINRKKFLSFAKTIGKLTRRKKIIFIINDYLDIAQAVDADGVHLGHDDISISEARKILGPEKIIGFSTHNLKEALKAQKDEADYVSVGPIFSSPTKPHLKPVGLDLLKQIKSKIKIPIVAIGGINQQNIRKIKKLGINRAAVISAVMNAKNPRAAIYQLKQKML